MTHVMLLAVLVIVALGTTANAASFRFETDPFAGSTALTTPGRQVIGGEPFVTFNIASDIFSVDPNVFGIGDTVAFANDTIENLPTGGANFIVLRTFDNDADPLTLFGAGSAANLIAGQVTTPGAGFFIYFNQGLDLPRLVFSTNLDDPTADLKIIARMTNLSGQQAALADFTGANFQIEAIPEPSSGVLMSAAGLLWAAYVGARRRGLRKP